MQSKIIRENFLNFFKSKGHKIVPSAPIVVQNDPTLMFTNAGMNQFKDYFLGTKVATNKRVADTQKCLRVSGKHNDLEEVGFDTYHHTMFEMLGNWSFGDYFKDEAIAWAWELLTEVYKLPKERMYVTVFEGDSSENLLPDDESRSFWKRHLSEDRILDGSKKDNFWEMGDSGPCGPCSEIHIDLRPQSEVDKKSGNELVNQDHPQVVEVWNLVFIQYNRLSSGALEELPEKHVDTGMGFERLAMAIQAKESNYDTDVFQPLIKLIAERAGTVYGKDEKNDIAIRVISDHIRAISFTIADGQLPGNAKAGYVIRRILRRAVRYGYTFLDFKEPFLHELVPNLADQFKEVFPELTEQREFVARVVKEEEVSFLRTLDKGLKLLDELIEASTEKPISGKAIFQLFDTYGFPRDLSLLILREKQAFDKLADGWEQDFEHHLTEQKDRSRAAAKQETGDWTILGDSDDGSEFIGYDFLESESKVIRYRKVEEKNKSYFQIVLDKTPFYAESGGQVGDRGLLFFGEEKIAVFDTKKENDLIVHYCKELPFDLGSSVRATVDSNKRLLTQNNHSATHLMHSALREVLGDHVQQRGSLVNEKILRFDFSHFAKVTDEEIREVEKIVNERIRENIPLDEKRNVPINEAKAMGATALFGEKYGEYVRVITFNPDFSVELCGGTHVKATGSLGFFKIISESSVAAGVRRVEAVTSIQAEDYIYESIRTIEGLREILKSPQDVVKSVQNLIDEKQRIQQQLDQLNTEKARSLRKDISAARSEIEGLNTIFFKGEFPSNEAIKQIAFDLKNEIEHLVLLIAGDVNGKPNLTIMFSDDVIANHDLHAGNIIREIARHIQGGGGGQPFYATAGGKDANGLNDSLEAGKKLILDKIGVGV